MRLRSLLLALALCACAAPGVRPGTDDPLPGMLAALSGEWTNARQFAAAPEALKKAPAIGHPYDWIDLQHARFWTVEAPAIGAHVVYLEWRRGDATGALSRQRIWSFRRDAEGRIRMDFFTLKDPSRFAGKAEEPGAFRTLTMDDLIGYGEACGAFVTPRGAGAFDALIEPEVCRIVSQSGRKMGIASRITLMPTGLLYEEAGVADDLSYVFKVPGGPPYDFRRP
jgi:hypothetical protein